MSAFECKSVTEGGKVVTSKITLDGNEAMVRQKLIQMGLKPISVKKKIIDMEGFLDNLKQVKPKNKRGAIGIDEAVLVEDKEFRRNDC